MGFIKYEAPTRSKYFVYVDKDQMVFNTKVKNELLEGVDEVELYYNEEERVIGLKINDLGDERVAVRRYEPDRRPRVYCSSFLKAVGIKKAKNYPVKKENGFLFVYLD